MRSRCSKTGRDFHDAHAAHEALMHSAKCFNKLKTKTQQKHSVGITEKLIGHISSPNYRYIVPPRHPGSLASQGLPSTAPWRVLPPAGRPRRRQAPRRRGVSPPPCCPPPRPRGPAPTPSRGPRRPRPSCRDGLPGPVDRAATQLAARAVGWRACRRRAEGVAALAGLLGTSASHRRSGSRMGTWLCRARECTRSARPRGGRRPAAGPPRGQGRPLPTAARSPR